MKNNDKLKLQTAISVLVIFVGVVILIYAITVEDEPTLLAPMLIIIGAAWFFIMRYKKRQL